MRHVWRAKLAKQFAMSLGILDEMRPFDALRTAVQPNGRQTGIRLPELIISDFESNDK